MRAVKRVAVWLIEVLAEALLLGCLLGALVSTQTGLLYGVIGSAMAVPVVLFLHWYYLTRAFVGMAWRNQIPWLYPAIAAALFVAHMHYALAQSKSDLTPFAQATELPFLAGGACMVFACAFGGSWLLRKWLQSGSKAPGVSLTDPSGSA
jgi:hypothetical protein